MKLCSKCGIAENIIKSYYAEEKGKFYKVLVFSCRNPKCERYKTEEKEKNEIEIHKEDN